MIMRGCWSGNAIDLGDRQGCFNTGINSKNKNQVQCYAESSDGINFTKDFENPLLKETLCSASNEDFEILKYGGMEIIGTLLQDLQKMIMVVYYCIDLPIVDIGLL